MKKKIIWSVATLLTILLGGIIFLFPLHNGSSTPKDNVIDGVVNGSKIVDKSKKNIGTPKSDDESDTVGKNPPIKQEIIDRQEDKQAGIEEKNSNQPQQLQEENSINLVEVDFTKPNPPITQETIDRLER